ncbi:MAG TPA: 6-phosphogluconolactonase [Caulobacteraceae bacterium]|nr:6-phosphogluconolactonase [Caulobacteraceae bacterium]
MTLETFPSAEAAAAAAAQAIAGKLSRPGDKRLMVTGGRGPGAVYDRLAQTELDWAHVTVTLSDDRFVPLDAPESNEAMVRARLMQGHAAAARLVGLNGHERTPAAAAAAIEPTIRALLPFDATLLGMGPDGHIASLYATSVGVAADLDPDAERLAVGVRSPGWEPYVPRISLTGRALFDAGLIVLLVGGEQKRHVIEQVLADVAYAPPVSALIRQTKAPVRILWSPDAA